ncbi:SCO family protein [Chitinophaga arvensicola]|uniref:Protein SCO1/2 n=1 Tax=Chitinophaga arvensicola TaxID=29529 RepID=A0A1I0RQ52_9BACT|nr:SCO family protein [Chitinophaga arvensicola]SEW43424.1 protein SCO1/2 [Chitinophaga arvensicola]
MSGKRFSILYSWQAAVAALIALPLLAWGVVRWSENQFGTLPYYSSNNQPADDKKDAVSLPAFRFTDQDNIPVTNQDLQHKITVANYFFTSCPAICPAMMQQLKRIAAADSTVMLLSFTVDPERDSPGALRSYAQRFAITSPGWKLLTGEKKNLYYFARKGLYITATDGDGGEDDFIHSENIVLLDQQQHIRGYYKGTSAAEVNLLLADIKKLQHEQ